jgi:uracil-DNA glycosylase
MLSDREKAARELLAFYQEAGVDALLGDEPVDRFADEAPIAAPAPAPAASPASAEPPSAFAALKLTRATNAPASEGQVVLAHELESRGRGGGAPPPPDAAIMAAREAARSAASLEELRSILQGFDGCSLKATAKQLVFSDGNPQARLMLVGEAPGRDEDIEGLPFVGRSGKLLDLMLAAIGLDRKSVYIANIVPWRPPGNRTPTPQETAICLPFILRQIELANPDVLLTLGNPSTQALLNTKEGITRTRGRWLPFNTGTREIRAMATLHPAYLLRQPLSKRLAWRDFLAIKKALGTES